MRTLVEMLTEMRETVPHLQSELSKRESSVAGVGWSISPAKTYGRGKRQEAKAQEIAEYVSMRMENLKILQDKLEHLCGAIYYGRSALEIVWSRDENGIGIGDLIDIYPQRLSYAKQGWRIHIYDEAGNEFEPRLASFPGIDIRDEFPDRFVIHEPRTIGAVVPTRQGLGRVLVYCALFWKWNARDRMVFAEMFAKPWRIGIYDKSADQEDIDALTQQLAALSGYSTAVFPQGTKPEFLWPQGVGNSSIHEKIHETWEREISKVVNGATLDAESGGGGSLARDEVKERTEYKLVSKDGNALEETWRRDVITPLVRKQYGVEASLTLCPSFKLNTEPPRDADKESERIFAFVDRGGEVDADEFRTKYTGLSKPAKDATLLKPLSKLGATDPASSEQDTKKPKATKKPADSSDTANDAKEEEE